MEKLVTKSCVIEYNIKEPSKISDFDYDPNNIRRRFISTYIHSITFKDKITDAELVSIGFPSETCANIIVGIMETDILNNPNRLLSSIKGVFVNNSPKPGIMTIGRRYNWDGVTLTIIGDNETYKFDLERDEIYKFVDLLENDQIVEMFSISSDGEW